MIAKQRRPAPPRGARRRSARPRNRDCAAARRPPRRARDRRSTPTSQSIASPSRSRRSSFAAGLDARRERDGDRLFGLASAASQPRARPARRDRPVASARSGAPPACASTVAASATPCARKPLPAPRLGAGSGACEASAAARASSPAGALALMRDQHEIRRRAAAPRASSAARWPRRLHHVRRNDDRRPWPARDGSSAAPSRSARGCGRSGC